MKYAILAVLCLATSAFATIGYDAGTKTLTYGAAGDLSTMVDPLGEGQNLTDPAAMFGNLTKDGFNALAGLQVIGFNCGLTPAQFNSTTRINAAHDATHVLTVTDFGAPSGYNIGGGTGNPTYGRYQYSGANDYDQMGTVQGEAGAVGTFHLPAEGMAMNWFAANLSVNQANAGVTALGFVCDGRNTQTTGPGKIWVTLNGTTEVSFDYGTFGGNAPATQPLGIGFFYQAPAGQFITRIECTRDSGSGNSYIPLDDLGFVISGGTPPLYIHAHDGDTNNDGACNVVDLGVLAKYYDSTSLPTSAVDPFGAGSWQKADFNNDGNVNVVDLGVLAKNYDWVGAPAVPTPEPATLSLLAVGGLALIRRRK